MLQSVTAAVSRGFKLYKKVIEISGLAQIAQSNHLGEHEVGMKILGRSCEGELAGGTCKHMTSGERGKSGVREGIRRTEYAKELRCQEFKGSILCIMNL